MQLARFRAPWPPEPASLSGGEGDAYFEKKNADPRAAWIRCTHAHNRRRVGKGAIPIADKFVRICHAKLEWLQALARFRTSGSYTGRSLVWSRCRNGDSACDLLSGPARSSRNNHCMIRCAPGLHADPRAAAQSDPRGIRVGSLLRFRQEGSLL